VSQDSPDQDIVFFATPADFRAWLAANHETATELLVGFYKKGTGRPSLTWQEAVDQALCFGWIDGVRRSIDADSYLNRFTPRKPTSNWSNVNIARVAALTAAGLMQPAGLRAFAARTQAKSGVYSFEQGEPQTLPPELEAPFRMNAAAWAFWEAQPPGYRRTAAWWVVSAKQEATRLRRLATLIEDSAAGRRLAHLARPARKPAPDQ
jgi:uncharacterized protein YdeI (YjbR/CyaY-like superfamily)